ncbi:efflux RND transporter periplasmic adaptor subunit [Candidatus Nitrospira bockiana]
MIARKVIWTATLAGVAAGALSLTVFNASSPEATAPRAAGQHADASGLASVQVVKPARRHLRKTLTIPATIAPWQQATVYAKVPGYLKSVSVDKGDVVKRGQRLAVIDAPEIEQQYREAQAQHEIKRLTYERYHRVWRETPDVIAKQDVDVAEAEAKATRHLRDTRKVLLDYTTVYAPFDGLITARFVDPGALIPSATASAGQGAALFTLMELDTLRVYAGLPQEVSFLAKPGLPVVLRLKELPGREFTAAITRTTGVLDPSTRTLLVEIDLPNPEHRLQPGMFITATFYLEERPDALAIPPSAILDSGPDDKAVFIVDQGIVRRAGIRTGLDDGVWVEVVDGLSGDEDVVVVGKGELVPGQRVRASPYLLPQGTPSSQKL